MYKAYWNMTHNPFSNDDSKFLFESGDYRNAFLRLKYLTVQKGFGLFTGLPGTGKTYTLNAFLSGLNRNLYKVIYSPHSTLTLMDFYRNLAFGLDIDPAFRKVDLFRQIQQRIAVLSESKNITPVIVLDEAQYLKTAILNDLKIIFNFKMDSCRHAVVILLGLPVLNNILVKQVHEAVAQRVIVNYTFSGVSRSEMDDYVRLGLESCGASNNIFMPAACEALFSAAAGSIRKLNALISNALIIGTQNKLQAIDTDTVMFAQNDLNLV